jgi:hypothetical protein
MSGSGRLLPVGKASKALECLFRKHLHQWWTNPAKSARIILRKSREIK